MPTLNLFINIPVDAVVASDILKDATKVVAKIIGKPESWIGVLANTSDTGFGTLYKYNNRIFYTFHIQKKDGSSGINKLENYINLYVMILLNGGVPIAFAGTEEPAAYGELISIGGLGPSVNGKLSSAIAEILETKLNLDSSRFYIKFSDVERSFFGFNGSTF